MKTLHRSKKIQLEQQDWTCIYKPGVYKRKGVVRKYAYICTAPNPNEESKTAVVPQPIATRERWYEPKQQMTAVPKFEKVGNRRPERIKSMRDWEAALNEASVSNNASYEEPKVYDATDANRNTTANPWAQFRFNRGLSKSHDGIDVGAPIAGNPANSALYHFNVEGTVYRVKIQRNKKGKEVGNGPYIGVDHGDHVCFFGHLPSLPKNPATGKIWKVGEKMYPGQKIADRMSTRGNASKPICHVEARLKKADGTLDKPVDPRKFHLELLNLRLQ